MDVELADGRILMLADRFNLDHSRSGVFTAARWSSSNAPAGYAVSVAPEVRSVVVAGETKAVQGREFQLTRLEFCREETEQETLFDGLTERRIPRWRPTCSFRQLPRSSR